MCTEGRDAWRRRPAARFADLTLDPTLDEATAAFLIHTVPRRNVKGGVGKAARGLLESVGKERADQLNLTGAAAHSRGDRERGLGGSDTQTGGFRMPISTSDRARLPAASHALMTRR